MRKIIVSMVALLLGISLFTADAFAQQGPPPWAPAKGYRAKARYTYFPSLNFYFDTKGGFYFFLEGGTWVRRTSLPDKYKNYNWSKYKYEEFDWDNDQPWEKHQGKSGSTPASSKGNKGKSNGKSKGNGKG